MLESAPTRVRKDVLYTILPLLALVINLSSMSSHHNTTLNFSHSPYNNKTHISEIDLEIKMGEFRLRYVKLMRDVHDFLSKKDAENLLRESVTIWEKLNNQNSIKQR